jgi:hypothetical protein
MQASGPVDGDVGLLVEEVPGGGHGGAAVERDVVPEAVEDGAVVGVATEAVGDVLGVFGLGVLWGDSVRSLVHISVHAMCTAYSLRYERYCLS